ncbi:Transcription initiation factor TFIID subunit 13 [Acipenser ruthenus]|uniref:Transcription initiation factor TFIID subunit 13 n=1 Tax=Acipenser ruthenus TaxID=7906 RepID=A0A444V3B7_ACIRT|nr:Transcription initiation factor TFIID subunit 13 [Acipenser ruthenus]
MRRNRKENTWYWKNRTYRCTPTDTIAAPISSRIADEDDDPGFEEDIEEAGSGAEGGQGKRKRLFSKELRCMMYGFGDDQNPYTESVDILEDLVIEFITEMTHKAMSIGRQGRVQVEDIVFLIRKDPRKFARVKDLLTMNEELKRARKAFDEANYGS